MFNLYKDGLDLDSLRHYCMKHGEVKSLCHQTMAHTCSNIQNYAILYFQTIVASNIL